MTEATARLTGSLRRLPGLLGGAALLIFSLAPPVQAPRATAAPVPTEFALNCPAGFEARSYGCANLSGPERPLDKRAAEADLAAPYIAGSGMPVAGAFASAMTQRTALAAAASGSAARAWQQVGKSPLRGDGKFDQAPNNTFIDALGLRHLTGRVTDFAYDPVTTKIWAGTAEGGVWQTVKGAKFWTSIGDQLPTQAVGAVAWDPANGGTLLVGTGDNAQGRYSYGGHGVYYTHDAGQTWLQASGLPDNASTFRIAVDPTNNQLVYVALSRGLFRSTDGGVSFANVNLPTTPAGYPVNCAGDLTHNPACFLANEVSDVVVRGVANANSPAVSSTLNGQLHAGSVLAMVGTRFGANTYPTADGRGTTTLKYVPQAGAYRSADGTPGSFKYVDPASSGFPTSDHVGRVALGTTTGPTQNHNIIYALVDDPKKENNCSDSGTPLDICMAGQSVVVPTPGANLSTSLDGAYFTRDFGNSWTKIMDSAQLNEVGTGSAVGGPGGLAPVGYGPGVQASYNLWIQPDPSGAAANGDPTRLFFGLEEPWESNPQYLGLNQLTTTYTQQTPAPPPWKVISRYWNSCGAFTYGQGVQCNTASSPIPGTVTHPDQHAQLMIPDSDGLTLYLGNDGGVFRQRQLTGSDFSQDAWGDGNSDGIQALQCYNAEISKDGTVVCGLQDNGEMKVDPKTGDQFEIFGGDGTWSIIDPNNSKNIVEQYVYGRASETNDGGVTWGSAASNVTSGRFATPIQADPRDAKHWLIAGREVKEDTRGFQPPACYPGAGDYPQCPLIVPPWTTTWNLGTAKHPGDASATAAAGDGDNAGTAVDLNGDSMYVGFCSSCDVFLEGVPFTNGIATNVGGAKPPKSKTADGWHIAKLLCGNCVGTNGRLPQRYITSVRMDPADPNTIYVTEGGYQRQWIPPGTFGEANPYIGQGHVFKSTDHGDHFSDITANLPEAVAWFSVVHDGHLVVSTDIGVFQSGDTKGANFTLLGTGLPTAPVRSIRISPGNPDLLLASTWGRGPYLYCFSGPTCPTDLTPPTTVSVVGPLPNTARGLVTGPAGALVVAGLAGWLLLRRRRPIH